MFKRFHQSLSFCFRIELLFELDIEVKLARNVFFNDLVVVTRGRFFGVVQRPKTFRMADNEIASSACVGFEGEDFEVAGKTFREVQRVALLRKYFVHDRRRLKIKEFLMLYSRFLFLFFKKMGHHRPLLSLIFGLFKQILQFFEQCEKGPSTIWCKDSNPRPLGRDSPPITIRPGLPPWFLFLYFRNFQADYNN